MSDVTLSDEKKLELDILEPNKLRDEPLADETGDAAAPGAGDEAGSDDSAAESEPAAQGEDAKAEGAEAEALDDAADTAGDRKKPKPKVQKRIDELTKARHDAERRATQLEAEVKRLTPTAQPDLTAPNPADFEHGAQDANYIAALAVHNVELRREAARTEDLKRAEQDRADQAKIEWQARAAEAATRYEDFRDVAFNEHLPITETLANVIRAAEAGPDVLYHLGKNPDEAARIAVLSPTRQAIEVGKIESRILEGAPAEPLPKKSTAAPAPAPRLGGKSAPAKNPESMTYDEFKAWRMEQEKNRR